MPPCVPLTEEGSPTASIRSPIKPDSEASNEPTPDAHEEQDRQYEAANDFPEDYDGFGEFDEFEEGEEGNDDCLECWLKSIPKYPLFLTLLSLIFSSLYRFS